MHAFRWLNHHLRGVDDLIDSPAVAMFDPDQLRVLESIPADQRNTTIDETFVPAAPTAEPPQSVAQWRKDAERWRKRLLEETFGGWPGQPDDPPPPLRTSSETSSWENASPSRPWIAVTWVATQPPWELPVVLVSASPQAQRIRLVLVDEHEWTETLQRLTALAPAAAAEFLEDERPTLHPTPDAETREWLNHLSEKGAALALVAVRGVGPTAWRAEPKQANPDSSPLLSVGTNPGRHARLGRLADRSRASSGAIPRSSIGLWKGDATWRESPCTPRSFAPWTACTCMGCRPRSAKAPRC